MAEILKDGEFEFKKSGGKKHPWSEWLDGQVRKLTKDDFGDIKLSTIATQARGKSKKRGLKARISVNEKEGYVILQAYKPEVESNGEAQQRQQEEEETKQEEEPREQEQPQKGKGRKGKKGEQAQ
jgi:hypothetical protein